MLYHRNQLLGVTSELNVLGRYCSVKGIYGWFCHFQGELFYSYEDTNRDTDYNTFHINVVPHEPGFSIQIQDKYTIPSNL